ncbi:tail protein X [Altericroceibacterium endophyticum]|uniref:Phage tail protein n=1 Tax=Altericroceibacterium endophyticum TaxID=1808508 RepID=A0A6I4T3J1_9SPHN|nr:tail protein X [Altericroceibacterium endophyticum]MXO64839.1 phage tail protein [Altericroceibacterium endophyticum]
MPGDTVISHQGETLDLILWRHRGRTAGLVERTIALNPGLADHGPVLPAGAAITLPEIAPFLPRRETVKLWG